MTADGGVKAGHDTSHPFVATSKNDVVTKAYTDAYTLQPDKANDITSKLPVKCNNSTFSIRAAGRAGFVQPERAQNLRPCGNQGLHR